MKDATEDMASAMTPLADIGRATIGDAVRRNALRHPQKVALIDAESGHSITYGELDALSDAFARALESLGAPAADGGGVAAYASSRVEYVIAYLGALKVGARFTGLNTRLLAHELRWQINDARPAVLIVDQAHSALIRDLADELPTVRAYVQIDAPADHPGWLDMTGLLARHAGSGHRTDGVSEDSIALLTYTSGTEARSKGVLVSHRNYLIGTMPSLLIDGYIGPSGVELLAKPLFTIAGLGSVTSHLLVGATIVLVHRVTPEIVLAAVPRYRVTTLSQTPTFYLALTGDAAFSRVDWTSLTQCHTYGGLISRAALERFRAVAPNALWASYWGQSELTQLGTIGWFRDFADVPEGDPRWIGRPTAGLEVEVLSDEGDPAEVGELVCRSPSLMCGYHDLPELTASVLRGGWLHTGDIVRRGPQGDLFFVDRQKDTIKSGGMNVSSQEVEAVLLEHPSISEVAVVGLPDEYWSEAITAFVVPTLGAAAIDADEVRSFCKARLAGYKVPKRVFVEPELPRDAQGKVQKKILRQRFAEHE